VLHEREPASLAAQLLGGEADELLVVAEQHRARARRATRSRRRAFMLNPSACAAPPPACAGGPATAALIRRRARPGGLQRVRVHVHAVTPSRAAPTPPRDCAPTGRERWARRPRRPPRAARARDAPGWRESHATHPAAGLRPRRLDQLPAPGTRATASAAPSSSRGGNRWRSG
jgi:hypothetical protein